MNLKTKKLACLLLLTGLVGAGALYAQTDLHTLVEIERINVTGTRCPANSIVALSGLALHDKVREVDVNAACKRIMAAGLFKSIDYTYDAYPDRPGVVLNLAVADEGLLVPCSIKLAGEEASIWANLQQADRIFTRQMPPTEKAIAFYERRIGKWLQANGRSNEYAAGTVIGDSQGNPSAIVFEIRQYKSLPSKR